MDELEISHKAKTDMLESMSKIMKNVLGREKHSIGIQAEDGELLWLPEHYLGVIGNFLYIFRKNSRIRKIQ